MADDTLFVMRDPEGLYSQSSIVYLLQCAERQGFPLEKGSFLENLTVGQLDRLVHGLYDA